MFFLVLFNFLSKTFLFRFAFIEKFINYFCRSFFLDFNHLYYFLNKTVERKFNFIN